jgi:hypothetical protein
MGSVTNKIESGLKPTMNDIAIDLNSGDWDALYFATEKQINKLIDEGKISEDFSSRYEDYQEEMRCMTAEFIG